MAEFWGNMASGTSLLSFSFAALLMLSVGLMLGMVGGGGSLLAVPILVYLAGLPAAAAIAISLPIVGITSLVGAIMKAMRSEFDFKLFLLFGIVGSAGAVGGAQLTSLVSEAILLLLFAAILTAVALKIWLQKPITNDDVSTNLTQCGIAALGVGGLTGFLGTGGGFLLVPALQYFARQNIKMAAGTSLGIIALNAMAGFIAHWSEVHSRLNLVATFTLITVLGLGIGLSVSTKIQARTLEKIFAIVAMAVAIFLFATNI